MDRSDDFVKVCEVFRSSDAGNEKNEVVLSCELSQFMKQSLNIAVNMESNDSLVKKMERLTNQKEFSNDPTAAIQEISSTFERSISEVKSQFEFLRRESENTRQGKQTAQHRKYIIEFLSKTMSDHIAAFKRALKTHSEHVEARNKRVTKFGSKVEGSTLTSSLADGSKYALFNTNNKPLINVPDDGGLLGNRRTDFRNRRASSQRQQQQQQNQNQVAAATTMTEQEPTVGVAIEEVNVSVIPAPFSGGNTQNNSNHSQTLGAKVNSGSGIRYDVFNTPTSSGSSGGAFGSVTSRHPRSTAASSSSSSSSAKGTAHNVRNSSPYLQQQQQQQQYNPKVKDTSRMKAAEQVEASIAQMGQLFSQMATLVSEQSSVIMNIEDDVEAGLQDTMEAHKSMTRFQEITKGNRGMIIKIFLLLAFFVILFLYWT